MTTLPLFGRSISPDAEFLHATISANKSGVDVYYAVRQRIHRRGPRDENQPWMAPDRDAPAGSFVAGHTYRVIHLRSGVTEHLFRDLSWVGAEDYESTVATLETDARERRHYMILWDPALTWDLLLRDAQENWGFPRGEPAVWLHMRPLTNLSKKARAGSPRDAFAALARDDVEDAFVARVLGATDADDWAAIVGAAGQLFDKTDDFEQHVAAVLVLDRLMCLVAPASAVPPDMQGRDQDRQAPELASSSI